MVGQIVPTKWEKKKKSSMFRVGGAWKKRNLSQTGRKGKTPYLKRNRQE